MYSVVLMMALTTGGNMQSFGHRGGCCGGDSCCGGGDSCCGGGRHRLFGGHRHGCSSCCGGGYSCCGGGYSSCCGGGYSGCCGGCTGCTGCTGGVQWGTPVGVPVETKPMTKPEEIPTKPTDKPKESAVPAPATIIVSLPADAKLTIDGAATISTSSERVFTSPLLPAGEDFHYTLKAEYVRDGQPVAFSKDVTVRAGLETRVNMEPTSGVASR